MKFFPLIYIAQHMNDFKKNKIPLDVKQFLIYNKNKNKKGFIGYEHNFNYMSSLYKHLWTVFHTVGTFKKQ